MDIKEIFSEIIKSGVSVEIVPDDSTNTVRVSLNKAIGGTVFEARNTCTFDYLNNSHPKIVELKFWEFIGKSLQAIKEEQNDLVEKGKDIYRGLGSSKERLELMNKYDKSTERKSIDGNYSDEFYKWISLNQSTSE